MLYSEIITVCSEIHTKHINTLCEQNVELLNVKSGGTYSDHWVFLRCWCMSVVYVSCPRLCTSANSFGMVVGDPFEIQRNVYCTGSTHLITSLPQKNRRIYNNRNKNFELRDLAL